MRVVVSIARGDGKRTVTTYSNENPFPNGTIWSKSTVIESDITAAIGALGRDP